MQWPTLVAFPFCNLLSCEGKLWAQRIMDIWLYTFFKFQLVGRKRYKYFLWTFHLLAKYNIQPTFFFITHSAQKSQDSSKRMITMFTLHLPKYEISKFWYASTQEKKFWNDLFPFARLRENEWRKHTHLECNFLVMKGR